MELSFGVLASGTEATLFNLGTYLRGSTNLRGNTGSDFTTVSLRKTLT